MPIDATPFEQVVVFAVATKGTGEPTVAPLLGLLTVTFARADVANAEKARRMQKKVFIPVGTSSLFLTGVLVESQVLKCLMTRTD